MRSSAEIVTDPRMEQIQKLAKIAIDAEAEARWQGSKLLRGRAEGRGPYLSHDRLHELATERTPCVENARLNRCESAEGRLKRNPMYRVSVY